MNRSIRLAALPAVLLMLSAPAWAVRSRNPQPLYRAGEVIVEYRGSAQASAALALKSRLQMRPAAQAFGGRVELLKLPSVMSVRGALRTLAADPAVLHVQPNYVKRLQAPLPVPNDPMFGLQWALDNTGQANFVSGGPAGVPGADLNLLPAWSNVSAFDRTGSGNVKVAIVDDGFQLDHPDLQPNFIAGLHFTDNGSNSDLSPNDGHGTEVAGCLAAVGNNGLGVAGAIWHVQVLPLKFDSDTASEIAALQYAAANGASIVNASFGGPNYDPMEHDAIQALNSQGVLVVTSAGNNNSNTDIAGASYPANYQLPNVLAVAATNRQDDIASFSTFGPTSVQVAAPGLQIVSTEPGGGYSASPGLYGTSYSAPYAAGVAALIEDYAAPQDPLEVKGRLIDGANANAASLAQLTAGGRIDAAKSLTLGAQPSLVIAPVQIAAYSGSNPDGGSTPISVPITAPAQVIADSGNSCYPDPANPATNSCALNPGDTATLKIAVQNLWRDATGVSGHLTLANSDGSTAADFGTASFGSIAHGASGSGAFNIQVPSSAAGHQYLHFILQLTADGGYSVQRQFTLEAGTLADGVTVSQGIGTTLYDNYHTWTYTLPPGGLPSGDNTLSFQANASNDVDIIVSYNAPPQYMIDLNAAADPNATYFYSVPDSSTGAGFGAGGYTEYVNIPNPQPGVYYVTVVNFDQTAYASYQLEAFTNSGGYSYPSSTVEAQQALSNNDNGGGAFDPELLALLGAAPLLRRWLRYRRG